MENQTKIFEDMDNSALESRALKFFEEGNFLQSAIFYEDLLLRLEAENNVSKNERARIHNSAGMAFRHAGQSHKFASGD